MQAARAHAGSASVCQLFATFVDRAFTNLSPEDITSRDALRSTWTLPLLVNAIAAHGNHSTIVCTASKVLLDMLAVLGEHAPDECEAARQVRRCAECSFLAAWLIGLDAGHC